MTDLLAAVTQRVRFWRRGRVVLPPHRLRENLGGFGGGFGVVDGQGWGWLESMNSMQVKGAVFRPDNSVGQGPPQ
ncbi:MAG TPA: hypothetical protein DDX91_01110 [Ruminococcaceae bacterium]|nr:hypothetical protein [Oscillospiraceae bacterium]